MPSLRFFICNDCGTVYADVEQPAECHRCDDGLFEELEPGRQAFDYFTGG